ncbi:MAG: hypothetical protein KBS95_01015 [Alistipes sp.]|nr:hypothetical protein [Candidatus Alistipes equi]
MKKFFVALALLVFTASIAHAKDFGCAGYKGEISVAYGFGISNSANHFALSTTHGYQFDQSFFLGLGVESTVFEKCTFVPIFATLKYFPINGEKRIAPFASCRFGYGIFASADDDIDNGNCKGGFYTNPSIGLQFGVGKNDHAIEFSVGYTYQNASYKNFNVTTKGQNIQLRLGFIF